MAETRNVLLEISDAQVHEVDKGKEKLLEWGQLILSIHTIQDASSLWIEIGKTNWSFDSATPTLKATPHTFMFALGSGRFYSVLMAEGTPEEEVATFEEILMECTSFELAGAMSKQATEETVAEVANDVANDEDLPILLQQQPSKPGVKQTTSERILSGASVVQEKLMASANWASQKILEQSQAYQMKTEPCQKPMNISPEFANRVKLARRVAEKGNRAANRVAGGIADISVRMADTIVRHMGPTKYGQQLNDPNARPHAAKEVAAAAVVAAVGVYDSMEQAARLVLNSGGKATSDFIGHKYGPAAGDVAKDAAHASVTTGMTAMTVQKIGVKKIAKRIAKRTATGLVKSYVMPGKHPQENIQGSGLQPSSAAAQHASAGAATSQVYKAAPMQVSPAPTVMESNPAPVAEPTGYQSPFAN